MDKKETAAWFKAMNKKTSNADMMRAEARLAWLKNQSQTYAQGAAEQVARVSKNTVAEELARITRSA